MLQPPPHSQPRPVEKSKTELRRGQLTPGSPPARRPPTKRGGGGTSRAEEAMLFDEPVKGEM